MSNTLEDPFRMDWFDPSPRPHVDAPAPISQSRSRGVPDIDRLYAVQRQLVEAINLLPGSGGKGVTPGNHARLEDHIMDAYRSINKYLRDYSGAPQRASQFD